MAGKLTSVLLSAVLLSCKAARVSRQNATKGTGSVSHLFTFGAPHPSNPKLTTRNGGCFNGYRVISWDNDFGLDDEDIVPTLLTFTSYNHPNIRAMVVEDGGGLEGTWNCGKNPPRLTRPSALLHKGSVYENSMARLSSSYWRAKEASAVGLVNSYEDNLNTVRQNVAREGWNYVDTAFAGEDIVHLHQDPSSLRCMVTFEGSDSFGDWVTDAAIRRVSFCGLPFSVHVGFRNELRRMVDSSDFQNKIRPKLGKCSSVDAVGHSLGGAVASLFTVCVEWQNGSDDYNKMSWRTSRASRL